jgi:hypothetical protein
MTEQIANFGSTTLAEDLDASETTVTVTSGAVFPSSGDFRVNCEDELMLVTARSTNDLTVTRGAEGTTATTHSNGAAIKSVLTAASLQAIVRELDVGTSFPGSPATGRMYYRTDIRGGMLFRYDGTRWVSDEIFKLSIAPTQTGSFNATATMFGVGIPQTYDAYLLSVEAVYFASGLTSGAYWTLDVRRGQTGTETYVSLGTVNNQSGTNAQWVRWRFDIDTQVTAAQMASILVQLTKTGSPGATYLYGDIWYRQVAT